MFIKIVVNVYDHFPFGEVEKNVIVCYHCYLFLFLIVYLFVYLLFFNFLIKCQNQNYLLNYLYLFLFKRKFKLFSNISTCFFINNKMLTNQNMKVLNPFAININYFWL